MTLPLLLHPSGFSIHFLASLTAQKQFISVRQAPKNVSCYSPGQELQCKKSRSPELHMSPKFFCKGPQAKSIRWLSCSWFSCAGRRAHKMFWIRDLNCCHISAASAQIKRWKNKISLLTAKQQLGCGKVLPSSHFKRKPAPANLFNSVHLFQRLIISFYVCKENLSGIFCLLRSQTQAISGYQRSHTGYRRKCWSHSTEERKRSLIGCAQTRSSFQQELMKTKLWLKSSSCWVLDTGLYTYFHKLGIIPWEETLEDFRRVSSSGCQKKSGQRCYSYCTTEPVLSPRTGNEGQKCSFIPVKRVVPWMGLGVTPTGWSTGEPSRQIWHGQNSKAVRAATADITLVSCWCGEIGGKDQDPRLKKYQKSLQLLP